MSERQAVQRWMITVGGVEQARVGAGQSVEIGRKPIRPLRDDGFVRVDIVDNKRSMSKRHALLIVDKRGAATIRDLHSTNGTYLVSANGDLLRLEPDVDFQLPDSLMRMQLGDVPVDFVCVEDTAIEEKQDDEVRNLFSYATDDAHDEHAVPDLSVDQILDLRAGEPTGIFHAQSVAQPDLSWGKGQFAQNLSSGATLRSAAMNHPVTLPVVPEHEEKPIEPRDLFVDAQSLQQENIQQENIQQETVALQEHIQPNNELQENTQSNTQLDSVAHSEVFQETENQVSQESDISSFTTGPFATDIVGAVHRDLSAQTADMNHADTESVISGIDVIDNGVSYSPAFEPGSVFEKVSKGEFDAQQNMVEAGGFTSREAEESNDFSQQFEMAQYPELLPFLATNPGLYDDLYAWLAAQGNAEVDAALARNSGYSEYRKAIEQ